MPVRRQDVEAASTPAQRAQLRAQAIVESDDRPTFTRGDYTLTVTRGPELVSNTVVVEVQVVYVPTGETIPLTDANPFIFVNPPTKVPDGTVDAQGNPNFTFAPRQAFRQVLFDAVSDAVRRSGWHP